MFTRVFFCGVGWPALARLGGLAGLLAMGGCAAVPPSPPAVVPAPVAHLRLINQTNYDWRITLTNTSGKETVASPVPPRAAVPLELAGGDYVIEQVIISPTATPGLTRRIPARLEPGQTYHWRLDTLLSDSSGDPARDQK